MSDKKDVCQLGTPGQVVVSAAIPQARFPIIVLGEVNEKKGALTSMTHSPGLSSQVDIQQIIVTETHETDTDKLEYQKHAYVAVGLIMALTAISVLFPLVVTSSLLGMNKNVYYIPPPPPCLDPCRIVLLESIPLNLTYPDLSSRHISTYEGWKNLIKIANRSIDIASLYWSLRGSDIVPDPSAWQGEEIYNDLLKAGTKRGIKIRIAQSQPTKQTPCNDTQDFVNAGAAEVRSLNFTYLEGHGVLHTKLWIVDGTHVYVGSANMDWRSLTQVKELGAVVYNCSCLAQDAEKIFEAYWFLGQPNATVPSKWEPQYETRYNSEHPFSLSLNDTPATAYLSSSPPDFCPGGRTSDIDAILDVINKSQRFVHIAVMDYFPTTLYSNPKQFWPVIDDALRKAAIERGVYIRVLASWWNHTRPEMKAFLNSLAALNQVPGCNVEVKLFHVPPFSRQIPFTRVNHNKYMVTDNAAFIGTSNWSGDYFMWTGGVGLIVNQTKTPTDDIEELEELEQEKEQEDEGTSAYQQVVEIFDRDWNSTHAKPLSKVKRRRRPSSTVQKALGQNVL